MKALQWGTVGLSAFIVGFLAVGCAESPVEVGSRGDVESSDANTDFEKNKVVFVSIRKATYLKLYEGLPHPMMSLEGYKREKITKPTLTVHGDEFYAETLKLPEADQQALIKVLGDETSFEAWRGEKKCGGFH